MVKTNKYPARFLWGSAVSAHQVEGGTHNQWTEWEVENAKSLAARSEYQFGDLEIWSKIKNQAQNPANYVSSRAVGHYEKYEYDTAIMKAMGLNAFRFSIEWSRVEPRENGWDAAAITHYKEYIRHLKQNGIEPIVTLFHFTLPVWFVQLGGFEKRRNVKYFVRFAEKILHELGSDITYVITINEPEVYSEQSYLYGHWPPSQSSAGLYRRVLANLVRAHKQTARVIHKTSRRYKISIAKNATYHYPGDDSLISQFAAWKARRRDNRFLKRVIGTCDFIGVNYYFSSRWYGMRVHNPERKTSDLDWDIAPENLEFLLEQLNAKYKKPIIITENGIADLDDAKRQLWLKETFGAMERALGHGVQLRGYLHWSLLDNFEWAYGKWPRFGLVGVDYKTLQRKVRPSAKLYAAYIRKEGARQ